MSIDCGLSLPAGAVCWLRGWEGRRFISRNAWAASVLQNGKVIANHSGFTYIRVYDGEALTATIACEVGPGDPFRHILLNRYNGLSCPLGELVRLKEEDSFHNNRIFVAREIYPDLTEMCKAAKDDGIWLAVSAGYRSISDQQKIIEAFIEREGAEDAMKRCAPAGYSEHHSGLALDITGGTIQNGVYTESPEAAWDWIAGNCFRFGFMIKNLQGKEAVTGTRYEPWHIRWVGDRDLALELHERQITLDEYYDGLHIDKEVKLPDIPAPRGEYMSSELGYDIVYVTGSANLRAGPSMDHDVVAKVSAGTELSRTGTVGKWSRATYEGKDVYVSSKLVGIRAAYTVEPVSGSLMVSARKANIRAGAGRTYAILGTATTGDTFELTGRTDTEWCEILFEDQIAYVYSSLARISRESGEKGISEKPPQTARPKPGTKVPGVGDRYGLGKLFDDLYADIEKELMP